MTEKTGSVKVRGGSAVWRELDGETIVLDLEKSSYLALNDTGTLLWPAMVEGTSTDHLVDLLVERFGIPRSQAATDVAAFVARCRAHALLEP
jgi:hypothetical protein